jgi:DNA-binding transcriptional ArsR family regulator
MGTYQEQARYFHVLSHPVRLQILDILRGGEECVCHIQSVLGKRQAYVSQQLMVMRDAGLVTDRRDGLNVYYRLTDPSVAEMLAMVLGNTRKRARCGQAACVRCSS